MRRHQNELRFCWEQHISTTPEASRTLILRGRIDGVNAADVSIEPIDPASEHLRACIASAVARWSFTGASGEFALTIELAVRTGE